MKDADSRITLIEGQSIVALQGRGSFYSPNEVNAILDTGEICRINLSELTKVLNDYTFKYDFDNRIMLKAKMKRKYRHLTLYRSVDEDFTQF